MIASAVGAGMFTGALALLLWWKNKMPKLTAVLALITGLCIAGSVAQVTGIAQQMSTAVGLGAGAVVLILAFWFFMELKGHGHHPTRTPVIGLLLGVLAMTTGGAIGNAAHSIQGTVQHTVQNSTQFTTGK